MRRATEPGGTGRGAGGGPAGTWLTDAITLVRVPIACVMLLVRRHPRALAASFVLGAATDVTDGPLARRLGTASARGARLDSAAGAVFVAASAVTAMTTVDRALRPRVACFAAVVGAARVVALAVTRRRFGRWAIMHTRLNKASGAALGAVAAVSLVRGRMPIAALGLAAVVSELAALEEVVIVARATEYDPDRRSLFA